MNGKQQLVLLTNFLLLLIAPVARAGVVPDPIDVTAITGQQIAGPVTSWQTQDGPYTVEHLAGQSPAGELLAFFWSPRADWQVVNVSAITGQQIAGPVTSWVTDNVEHLAGVGLDSKLHVFWWTSSTDWRVVNVTQIAGGDLISNGAPTVYQLADDGENVELLGVHSQTGSLLLYWWKPSRDWQQVNLSEITGYTIAANPEGWLTPNGNNIIEHFAAPDPNQHLLVFWDYSEPRRLTDKLGEPFQSLQRVRSPRKIVTIFWDPHRPTEPASSRIEIENLLFDQANSVRDYFIENSNGYFTIESAGVFGWYDADKPWEHYWGPSDPTDADGDGWVGGHVEKWAEAIHKAEAEFDFASYDTNHDGVFSPDELGILIVIPQNGPFGTNRRPAGREYPVWEPLVVDGVRVDAIAEVYIGNPPNLGVVAHELSHLLLGHGDMYFTFFNSAAAGDFSLMDRTYKTTHLDPFAKLKLGWVRPKIIIRGDLYSLHNVEEGHDVWVLLDPTRSTDEYFIVENRWGDQSYDQQMADNGGLAVWHIMENPAVYGTVAPPPFVNPADWAKVSPGDWARRAIHMIRPVLTPPLDDSRALWDGAQPGADYDLLSSDLDPNHATLRWADGSPSGFSLRVISPAGPTMEATVEVP